MVKAGQWALLGITVAWMVGVLVYINLPARPPEPFPTQSDNLIPRRAPYHPQLASAFEQGRRELWQKPDKVLDSLGDLEGLVVADIGCGEGYFTLRLLERVGPTGHVFATDIQKELLAELEQRVPAQWSDRLTVVLSTEDEIGIEQQVDLILLIQVLGEVTHQKLFLTNLQRIMHPGTRLALIDSKHITDPQSGFTRPLNVPNLISELEALGFRLAPGYDRSEFDFLPKQFFLVLTLAPSQE